jgi:outer membrane lipoprotein-sorting protein
MKIAGWLAAGLALSSGIAMAQGDLKASMDKLDAASAQFKSVQADFHKELYNKLVRETTPQDGRMYFLREGGKPQLGLKTVGPGARTVQYKDGVAKVFNPAIKCFDTVGGGDQSKTDTLLALGFGGSGKDLQASWNVTDQGPDTVNGVKVEKLDMVPKDPGIKSNIDHVTLWVVLERGYALKQVMVAPSGDITTAVYSNVKYNDSKVDTKAFDFGGGAKPCGK